MMPDLLELLAAHTPTDDREAESLGEIQALIRSVEAPFSRETFDPGHLTASAVVVDSTHTRAVLIFHRKLELWLQPGGHFEPDERDPAQAAAREVLEETGLRTRWPGDTPHLLDVDVHPIPARKSEPAHRHFDLRYLLVAEGTEGVAGDGTSGVRWVDLRSAGGLGLDPGLVRALSKVKPF